MYESGATTYDPVLANELMDKYKNDPDVKIIEKEYVQMESEHKSSFAVPKLPWHDD